MYKLGLATLGDVTKIGLLRFKSDLSSTTKCDKVMAIMAINLVTPKAAAKQELLSNKPASDPI